MSHRDGPFEQYAYPSDKGAAQHVYMQPDIYLVRFSFLLKCRKDYVYLLTCALNNAVILPL